MKKRQNRIQVKRPSLDAVQNSVEKWGDSIESAVKLALEELQLTEDQVEVEVLEEPSKGFLGIIGTKLAKVKVSRKVVEEEPAPKEKKEKKVSGPIRKEEVTEEEIKSLREGRSERTEKPERKDRKRDNKQKKTEEKIETEPVMPAIDMDSLTDLEEHEGLTFLQNVIKEMGLEINVVGKTDGKDIFFFMDGKDSGTIIGKRGATLDAIQYLTSLVVNKEGSDYIRVVVDAENYRAKREKSLEKLAVRLADKVVRSKRSYKLEPMNPYERKVIHATLQKDPRIITRSEGQDPARRVIIELK